MTAAPPDLSWAVEALGRPAAGAATRYLAVPAGGRPTALVLDDRRAVAAYLRLSSGRDGTLRRAARAAAGRAALATGQWALGSDDVRLGGGDEAAVGDGPAGATTASVLGWLTRHLHRDDLPHAVLLGSPRANRKPVVVVADDRGRATAFAKVGWNPLTRTLVDHEAAVLSGARPGGLLRLPPVLGHQELDGRSVLVLGDVAGGVPWWRPGGLSVERLGAVARAVHELGRPTVCRLDASAFAATLRSRASTTPAAADLVERALDRHGHLDVALGGVHGDLTPWNVRDRGDDVAVWDWERFDPAAPAGVDVLHHEFQRRLHDGGRPFGAALDEARRAAHRHLGAAGARPGTEAAVAVLHLVDLLLRYTHDLPDAPPGSPLAGRVEEVSQRLREDLA